jgi:glycosyltransferase involved in cell wall biosynthesis
LKILTLNHHESFLSTLAGVGHEFDVIEQYQGLDLSWNRQRRPVPPNFNLIRWDSALHERLKSGYYDLIIMHTVKNMLWFMPYASNHYLFTAHIPLYFDSPVHAAKALGKRAILEAFQRSRPCKFVAVSSLKLDAWRVRGEFIPLAPAPMPKISYDKPLKAVAVGNLFLERGSELGYPLLASIRNDFDVTTIGNNPRIPGNLLPRDFAEYGEILKKYSIYLYTVTSDQGDGYNTAMLEAMSMGMAVVSINNRTSPIEHGVNGLIGHSREELIQHLTHLKNDEALVRRLGAAAQNTIKERFSFELYLERWQRAITAAARPLKGA